MTGPGRPCRVPPCPQLRPCPAHGEPKPWGNKRATQGVSGYEWQRRRARVIERDGGICQLRLAGCTTAATTADHIVGVAEGGSDDESNLRASCRACNEQRRIEQSRLGRKRQGGGLYF